MRLSGIEAGIFAIVTTSATWLLLTNFWLRPGPLREASLRRTVVEIVAVATACIVGIGVTGYLLLIAAGAL